MERKSDAVRRLLREGKQKEALRIAKGFRLGITLQQQRDMSMAYECIVHPAFYASLGMDTEQIINNGIGVIHSLYGCDPRRKSQ